MYVIYHVTDFSNHYISADDKAASISLIRSHHRQEIVNSSPQNAQLQGCVYYIHTEMMVLTETYIHACTHTYILCHEYIRHAHIQTSNMQTYQQTYWLTCVHTCMHTEIKCCVDWNTRSKWSTAKEEKVKRFETHEHTLIMPTLKAEIILCICLILEQHHKHYACNMNLVGSRWLQRTCDTY